MTNRWQFKPMQRMDLGTSNQQGISLTSQKSNSGTVNGTAVTASGRFCLDIFQLYFVVLQSPPIPFPHLLDPLNGDTSLSANGSSGLPMTLFLSHT